jgi:alpha-beta hydrolase superfamily lysophospholipase
MARRKRDAFPLIASLTGAAIGTAAAMWFTTGIGIRRPLSHPNPTNTAENAWNRLKELRSDEGDEIHGPGHTTLLEPSSSRPGDPTIVFFHGLTDSPDQFAWIGRVLRGAGYRVLLPRMPDHARIDRSAEHLAHHRADDLTAFADDAIDIAAGFGGPVWVAGLSAGGLLATWCGRTRPEVRRVVAIAPFFAPHGYRWSIVRAAARLEGLLPRTMHWWDPELLGDAALSPYGYAGFPVRGGSAYMRISESLYDERLPAQPNLERAVLVLNGSDKQVSDVRARECFRRCFRGHVAEYDEVTLPASLGWPHDFIGDWRSARPDPALVLRIVLSAIGVEGDAVPTSVDRYVSALGSA